MKDINYHGVCTQTFNCIFHFLVPTPNNTERGRVGVVIYFHEEGCILGEVTKYLVYNIYQRTEGGDCGLA